MMMKRKINRVKKEYQVYMHKVHVLCWLGHGNYVSQVLNDQTILAAALSVVPSKECYPGERVDMKYLEQITTWYNDKMSIKQDKGENKFKPKAPPLKNILLEQMKQRVFTTKKYMVFTFVSMLRSLGLQCRVMFNFVVLPIKPPSSELCSLSTKTNDESKKNKKDVKIKEEMKSSSGSKKMSKSKEGNIPQLDGNYDSSSESENIMQVDGADDKVSVKTRKQKIEAAKNSKKHLGSEINVDEESISPPKRVRKNVTMHAEKGGDTLSPATKQKDNISKTSPSKNSTPSNDINEKNVKKPTTRKSLSLNRLDSQNEIKGEKKPNSVNSRRTRSSKTSTNISKLVEQPIDVNESTSRKKSNKTPKIVVTNENNHDVSSKYFDSSENKGTRGGRKRTRTSEPKVNNNKAEQLNVTKSRAKSASTVVNKSKYFDKDTDKEPATKSVRSRSSKQTDNIAEDKKRVSHRDLTMKKVPKNDVTKDLIKIIKGRVKEAKAEAKKGIVKCEYKVICSLLVLLKFSDYTETKIKYRNKA